jgi:hypothetical protein
MTQLCVFDRVRVKFGNDRGHYGTIRSVNGDNCDYYGVKLDCHDAEMGYSGYELEFIERNKRPLWLGDPESEGTGCYVPQELCVCPECGGELAARCIHHEASTGRPIASGIELDCMNDLRDGKPAHKWHQSTWQPIRDKIAEWSIASK